MIINRKLLGNTAERDAQAFLENEDLTYITSNYRCRQGEIDLIMQHNQTLVFVEVRLRRNTSRGSAAESVTPNKQKKIMHCSQHYLSNNPQHSGISYRFDVLASNGEKNAKGRYSFDWIKNAFGA